MTEKILCVDDDPNILAGFQRNLRRQFSISTALGGEEGLLALDSQGPFAVVISDMKMPGLNGIQFLSKVKAKSPDTVRIMLTGNADVTTAVEAVNEGNIFRFLTKPCALECLAQTIEAGLRQHRLITAERELLEKTLNGSIKVLTEILSIVEPQSFGRAQLLKSSLHTLSKTMPIPDLWALDMAAMLSQIGHVTIPPEIIVKAHHKQPLLDVEAGMLERVPEIGHNLLANIPRMEQVADIVLYQDKRFDGTGFPDDAKKSADIPFGARVLKPLSDLLHLESAATPRVVALSQLRGRQGWYDPEILEQVCKCFAPADTEVYQETPHGVSAKDLRIGQVLLSDVTTSHGQLLISAGHVISETHLERIRNFARVAGIREPVYVRRDAPKQPVE
jgi:response regulator RpfG family c-di-GMP phosphodiesterase